MPKFFGRMGTVMLGEKEVVLSGPLNIYADTRTSEQRRRDQLRVKRHETSKKTGTRPTTPWEMSRRMEDPAFLAKHGLRHMPSTSWATPGKAATPVRRGIRVIVGGYQGPRNHARRLVWAWGRAALCIQCSRPIQTTAVRSVYKGKYGLLHKSHLR